MEFNIKNYLENMAYINKDFNSIWEEILDFIPKLTYKWKPGEANESDPLVVLLKELGIVEDKLNYNIDKNTLEQFPDLLTQLRTAYSVFKSMGYTPNWYRSATTSVNIIYNGGVGETNSSTINTAKEGDAVTWKVTPFKLGKFTQLGSEDLTQIYTTLEDVEFTPGTQALKPVNVIEGTCNDFEIGGNTLITANNLDSRNRLYFVQPNVAQNGIFISSNSNFNDITIESLDENESGINYNTATNDNVKEAQIWRRVTNIYQYLPGSYVFKFGIDPSNGSNYIQFPDDVSELIGNGIYIKYILSSGSQGNVGSGMISTLVNEPAIDDLPSLSKDNFSIGNPAATQNGKDPETIEEMQQNYERVVGTFDTLVTLRDYENYIYTAEDERGNHLVSNIRVSDRSNDLYNSYKYITQDTTGKFYRKTKTINSILSESETKAFTQYDLRLYPLKPKDNINTYTDFKFTFESPDGKAESAEGFEPWVKNIVNKVENVKTINHSWFVDKRKPAPVFLNYDISGELYLQKAVSRTEAAEIKNNIDTAIYRAVNSRELNWGEPVNYKNLIDIIKSADSRIQYAAISPINYSDVDIVGNSSENDPIDPTKLAIQAGVTPYLDLSPFRYFYGAGETTTYPSSQSGLNDSIVKVQPWIKIDGGTEITVGKNGTLSILVPGYRTETTYSNYFYAVYGDLNGDNIIQQKGSGISLNTPYTLKDNEVIYIFETREAAQNALKASITNATYKIIKGNIVNIAGSGSQVSSGSFPSGEVVNMGSKISISVIVPDENYIYNTNNPDPNNSKEGDPHSQVRILTNSEELLKTLLQEIPTDDDSKPKFNEYTLDIGEYLLFSNYEGDDSPSLEVGIIGEGNTIKTTKQVTAANIIGNTDLNIDGDALLKKLKEAALLNSSLDNLGTSNQSSLTGITVNNNVLSYRANNIYSFGEGYTIKVTNSTFKSADKAATAIGVKVFDPDEDENHNPKIVSITYQKKDDSSSEESPLPGLGGTDTYKYSYQLALTLTPGSYQGLYKNQNITLNDNNNINIEGNNKEGEDIPTPTVAVQSNKALIYSGGTGLLLSDDESNGLKIISTPSDQDFGDDSTYFIEAPESIGIPKDLNIAGFVIPYIVENNNTVHYYMVTNEGSKSISITTEDDGKKATGLGPIYAINKYTDNDKGITGYRYYKLDEKTYDTGTIENGNLKLTGWDPLFCPIYQPSDSEIIENPADPNSFFKPQHPLNRYVMPRLTGSEGTAPLKGLEVSPLSIRG